MPIVHDTIVENDCGIRRRPDITIDLGDRVIVPEIDEHQHRGYDTTCEESRVHEVFRTLNSNDPDAPIRPVTFIRFNVDSYDSHGPMIEYSATGIIEETDEFDYRYQALVEAIREACETVEEEPVVTKYLFYTLG